LDIPYVVFENEDDVTIRGGKELTLRLEHCLDTLWQLYTE
jgi:hypothetical protein